MKHHIYFYILLLSASFGCGRSRLVTKDRVSIGLDQTDSLLAVFDITPERITPFLTILQGPEYMFNGADAKVFSLTNVRMSEEATASVEPGDPNEGNDVRRKQEAEAFKTSLARCLTSIQSRPIGRPTSLIFAHIAQELTWLAECTDCEKRTLILASDVSEFSTVFNSYDSVQLARIATCQPCFDSLMNQVSIPARLDNISVYLIHRSVDVQTDRRFTIISDRLKHFLEHRNAKVTIASSLNTQ